MLAAAIASFADDATSQEQVRPYTVIGDAIPESLTGAKGDAERGRGGLPEEEEREPGIVESKCDPAKPSPTGTGARWSDGQLRLRIVDPSRLNPNTIMPPYYRTEGLTRVAPAYQGKPVLSAQQIEDVVAYLATLRDERAP